MLARWSRRCGQAVLLAGMVFGGAAGAAAEDRALIITNANYPPGYVLLGPDADAISAVRVARKMGVATSAITTLRDATVAEIEEALGTLAGQVSQGDRAFIYFSGHGGRFQVKRQNRCAESLVGIKGRHLIDERVEERLAAIAERASKVIVMVDACHSGGVTFRQSAKLRPKFFKGGDDGDTCTTASNVVLRSVAKGGALVDDPMANVVYISAARADEVSLDSFDGGIATLAWTECFLDGASDANRSGGVTAEEVRLCAQARINHRLRDYPGFKPHHVTITGNKNLVLQFAPPPEAEAGFEPAAADAQEPSDALPSPTSLAEEGGQSLPPMPDEAQEVAALPLPPAPIRPQDVLADILNSADATLGVTIVPQDTVLTIGQETLAMSVTSARDGWLYILTVGSDSTTVDLLFPNAIDQDNRIRQGQTLDLPRETWRVVAGGPPGETSVLALVTAQRRDHAALQGQAAGPFSLIPADQANAAGLQRWAHHLDACDGADCNRAYGAALVAITEVEVEK